MRVRPAFFSSLLSCDTTNIWNFLFYVDVFNQLDIRQEAMGGVKEMQKMAYSQRVIADCADLRS